MDTELINKIKQFTLSSVKKSRYEHSERTALVAEKMGRLYGVDQERCYLAGISHDMCKEMSDELLISLSSRDGKTITELEKKKPSLLHGRAAAVKLQEDFGITDAEVLQAVANHTFGGEHLCSLAKIIFAADKIEPGRPQSSPEYLEHLLALNLNGLCASVLEENIDYLHKNGKVVAPVSVRFLDELRGDLV